MQQSKIIKTQTHKRDTNTHEQSVSRPVQRLCQCTPQVGGSPWNPPAEGRKASRYPYVSAETPSGAWLGQPVEGNQEAGNTKQEEVKASADATSAFVNRRLKHKIHTNMRRLKHIHTYMHK